MSEKSEEFLATARKRFDAAKEDEKDLRKAFLDDLRFASPDGDAQWDEDVKQQRIMARRPAMSFPRCHTFVQQVANDARQQKPQIKFDQGDDGDEETAEIMEGIARHIQYSSDAQFAYDTAIEYSASASFGYYRILTDYADDEGDDQEIKIVSVRDPLTVYGILVPAIFGRKPLYWFVVEDMPKEEYKAQYGDKFLNSSLSWDEAAERSDGWIGTESVRIAEYWTVEQTKGKNGRPGKPKIKFCKINGLEVLPDSETDWPGTRCNVIPVMGWQMIHEGKPKLFSVVRPQKAAQQLINYMKSRIAETLAVAPVSPWVAAKGQITGANATAWKMANVRPDVVLEYDIVDVNGHPAPSPQRQVYEPPIASMSAFVAQEIDDLKATTGIFDASLGNQANETSGKAILARKEQANLTTMHYMDNLERSFKQAGEVVGELIPKIYDGSRIVKILGPDEVQKAQKINQEHLGKDGKPKHFDISGAKGNWVISSGKAFSTKRKETADMLQGVIQAAPQTFPMWADIYFKNLDAAGNDQLAERFHKMLPPPLQDNENPLPPEAQAHIAQAQQQMQMMQGELQKLTFEKQAKVVEHQGKMQQIQLQGAQDENMERLKLANALTIAEVQTKAQNVNERLAAVEEMFKQFHIQAHDHAMQKDQQAHEAQQAQVQHQQAMQQAEQGVQHQAALADQGAMNQSAQSAQDAAQAQEAQANQPAE